MADKETQRWELTVRGRHHRVEVEGSLSRTIRWYVDDVLVASKKTYEHDVQLEAEQGAGEAIGLTSSVLGRARRVTLFEGDDAMGAEARALLDMGGIDLDPEPGSPAALREQRIRAHPWRHTAIATAGGVAKVVAPLLLGLLVVSFAVNLPWPSWNIPWPDIDLPTIPWPDLDLPQLPWPDVDLPDWRVPDWVRWVLDKVAYVWPILLAFVLVRGEIRRRRKQDALKAKMKLEAGPATVATDPNADHSTENQDVGTGGGAVSAETEEDRLGPEP